MREISPRMPAVRSTHCMSAELSSRMTTAKVRMRSLRRRPSGSLASTRFTTEANSIMRASLRRSPRRSILHKKA